MVVLDDFVLYRIEKNQHFSILCGAGSKSTSNFFWIVKVVVLDVPCIFELNWIVLFYCN